MKKNYISHIVLWVVTFVVGLWIGHVITIQVDHHAEMGHAHMDGDHDPMQMSMADMWAMLEWKTGDDLDRAFLEWMIPHHQGAIDMAEFLVDAKHPELQKMWEEIIKTQQAEIDQMNQWLKQWGYKN